jgi:hypothetical protein
VRSGKIGNPRLFESTFSMQVLDTDNIRLRLETGGGPLWDLGVYCINASRYLFRSEPEEVVAAVTHGGDVRFREVEGRPQALAGRGGDRQAALDRQLRVGRHSPPTASRHRRRSGTTRDEYAGELRHVLTIGTAGEQASRRDQFGPELLYFSGCILEGADPEPWPRRPAGPVIRDLPRGRAWSRSPSTLRGAAGRRSSRRCGVRRSKPDEIGARPLERLNARRAGRATEGSARPCGRSSAQRTRSSMPRTPASSEQWRAVEGSFARRRARGSGCRSSRTRGQALIRTRRNRTCRSPAGSLRRSVVLVPAPVAARHGGLPRLTDSRSSSRRDGGSSGELPSLR